MECIRKWSNSTNSARSVITMLRSKLLLHGHKPITRNGIRYRKCQWPDCIHNGEWIPLIKFQFVRYDNGNTRYSAVCNDCDEKLKFQWVKQYAIPEETIPPDVILVRGKPGANHGIENPYRPNKLSTILQRSVHFVDYQTDYDMIIAECGRVFENGDFDTTSEFLRYGHLCTQCVKIHKEKQRNYG